MEQAPFNFIPRLTVNVGITGHRRIAPETEPKLREQVYRFLQTIQREVNALLADKSLSFVHDLYLPQPPRYVLLSSLAFGADTMAAEEAEKLGYEIHVPLPMSQQEYEEDFDTDERKQTFRDYLNKAREAEHVYEITAANPERGHAYADAARVLLNHCDVLLALWDGKNTECIAGTAPTVDMAIRQNIPVIHIHTDTITPTSIITDGIRSTEWQEKLRKHIKSLLIPVEATDEQRTPSKSDMRFVQSAMSDNEPAPLRWRWHLGLLFLPWLIFRAETGFSRLLQKLPPRAEKNKEVAYIETKTNNDGNIQHDFPNVNPPSFLPRCKYFFDKFDKFADAYSRRYRGGLLVRYVAPVMATIFLALALCSKTWVPVCGQWIAQLIEWLFTFFTPTGADVVLPAWLYSQEWVLYWKIACFVLQGLFLLLPVMLHWADTCLMWHRKFFSYRVVGESLRQTQFLGSVGFISVSEQERTYKGSPQRWTAWRYRAILRDSGLPNAVVDHAYLKNWLLWTRDSLVVHQMNYHKMRVRREGNMCKKLVNAGLFLFVLGFAAAIGRAFISVLWLSEENLQDAGSFCALIFPAFAVFFAGFCAYACYAKDQQVSAECSDTLDSIRKEMDVFLRAEGYAIELDDQREKELQGVPFESLHFTLAYNLAEQINDCCKNELLGWEDLISTRNIKHM